MANENKVVVSGAFDDIRSRDLRFLEEASKLGPVQVLLWPDAEVARRTGSAPKFPLAERLYFLNAVRYVTEVRPVERLASFDALPEDLRAGVWADVENPASAVRAEFCARHGLVYRLFTSADLAGFPVLPPLPTPPGRKKVVVTGCYDWFHSGHVRFTEEVSAYGDLYVVVGNDANVRHLKGEGHPLVTETERRYVVGSIKYVKEALISSGHGWLDADPEIQRLKPDIYAVNDDGDKGGKREYCQERGMEYLVLKRTPAPGLTRRSSTDLRGF